MPSPLGHRRPQRPDGQRRLQAVRRAPPVPDFHRRLHPRGQVGFGRGLTTMTQEARIPQVGDTVLVGGTLFEIRAIIAEESSVILADTTKGRRQPEIWVLWDAEFVPVAAQRWRATGYRAFERAE